jgi:hypothetical protein
MVAVSELLFGLDAEFVRLEAVCADLITAGLAEWNQPRTAQLARLLLTGPDYAQCSLADPAPARPGRPALRITRHCS